MVSTDRPPLPALTSLRFFAAFYVVLFHGTTNFAKGSVLAGFLRTGYIAVDFFFVLSGFVLAYKYSGDDGAINVTKRRFWAARFARVYPVYVLSLIVGAPLYVQTLAHAHSRSMTIVLAVVSGVAALCLAQSWFYRTATSWNTPAWSLSVEAFLYLAFPVAMPALVRALRRSTTIVVVIALGALAIAAPLAYMLVKPDGPGAITEGGEGMWLITVRMTPIFHLPAFLIGAAVGWSYAHRSTALPKWLGSAVAAVIAVVLVFGDHLPFMLLGNGLIAPLFALLIYCVARPTDYLTQLLRWSPLVTLGDASYALYLLHFPLLLYARLLVGGELSIAQFAAFCVVTQIICLIVYRFFESPARAIVRRVFAG